MRRSWPARARHALLRSAATLCLLLLAACEDPSGVGLSVVDPGDSDPRAQVLPASSAASVPLTDQTGEFTTAAGFASFQALAGYAADPLFGTTVAHAYLDVLPDRLPDGFEDRPILKANLRLIRSYTYGDTNAPTRLDVRQIADEWTAVGASADTSFSVTDGVITSFDVTDDDSLVVVPLPDSWVQANDATLRSDDFSTTFHGFRFSTDATGGAVFGFNGRSSLELITERDTVRFGASELFSNLVHEPAPTFAAGLVPVQDGTSKGLGLDFDLADLGTPALNTAFLRVNADTLASQADLPAGFVRPLARELALFGTFDDGNAALLTTAVLDEETQTYSFRASIVTGILQELLIGRTPVDGFALGVPTARTSLDAVAVVAPPATTGPRAVLVLVPAQD